MDFKVITEYPIAYESLDHINPHGTARDNYTSIGLIDELEETFGPSNIKIADIGCSGGQFVIDIYSRGNIAIGLEGSDYSLKRGRANWKEYANKLLFTCDATKPYKILKDNEPLLFNVISAWEVVEHIAFQDLPNFFKYINDNLEFGGIFIASISQVHDIVNGINLHQTVYDKDTWTNEIWGNVLHDTKLTVHEYPYKYYVRHGKNSFHVMLKKDRL